jgi:hypothetical protein
MGMAGSVVGRYQPTGIRQRWKKPQGLRAIADVLFLNLTNKS